MNNFDFLVGSIAEFPSQVVTQRFFDGHISVEETIFSTRGTRGLALRLYNPTTDEWSIYWVDSRTIMSGTRR